jgi:hypothetical protein
MEKRIADKDIVFVTTTFFSKWLDYQQRCIKKLFPESEFIVIDGNRDWPYAWFYWLEKLKGRKEKWFVHIDEDCFLTSREELENLILEMASEDSTLAAVSDGFHHYRGANPVAINSFFMVGRTDHFNELNFSLDGIKFWHEDTGWRNSLGILYNEGKHRHDFLYPHDKMENGENCNYEQEPYYMILWMLKERGKKFKYLFPFFDDRFKSTNPRISKDSDDIAIHMWYTRTWESPAPIHGVPNVFRYQQIEAYLKKEILNEN